MDKNEFISKSWDIRMVTHEYQTLKIEKGISQIKVGIIDSGVDRSHPGLNNVNKCISLIDSEPEVDLAGHGTMIAGQISGNGIIPGIAPEIEIISYKITNHKNQSKIPFFIEALESALNDGLSVLNMSFGFYLESDLEQNSQIEKLEMLFDELYKRDVICISSSGYKGEDSRHYPSSFENVLSCQGLNKSGEKVNSNISADFCLPTGDYDVNPIFDSNSTKEIEFVPVYLPIELSHNISKHTGLPLGYSFMSGESFSAAKLTGIVAVLRSCYYRKFHKILDNRSTIRLLEENSKIINGSYYPDLLKILNYINSIS
ncbi:S8 family peptidase [Niallia sp. BSM11]|uniref:S8 family peptidase n=1 Tax=Niallia sp. BSM11 TaxID=3391576 RepID=UPI003984F5E1